MSKKENKIVIDLDDSDNDSNENNNKLIKEFDSIEEIVVVEKEDTSSSAHHSSTSSSSCQTSQNTRFSDQFSTISSSASVSPLKITTKSPENQNQNSNNNNSSSGNKHLHHSSNSNIPLFVDIPGGGDVTTSKCLSFEECVDLYLSVPPDVHPPGRANLVSAPSHAFACSESNRKQLVKSAVQSAEASIEGLLNNQQYCNFNLSMNNNNNNNGGMMHQQQQEQQQKHQELLAKRKQLFDLLTRDEALALVSFTIGTTCGNLNAWFSAKPFSSSQSHLSILKKHFAPMMVLLIRALEKLPLKIVKCFRGVRIQGVPYLQLMYETFPLQCPPGAILRNFSFSSWSTNEKISRDFAGSQGLLYQCSDFHCYDISLISAFPEQLEHIAIPPLYLRVLGTDSSEMRSVAASTRGGNHANNMMMGLKKLFVEQCRGESGFILKNDGSHRKEYFSRYVVPRNLQQNNNSSSINSNRYSNTHNAGTTTTATVTENQIASNNIAPARRTRSKSIEEVDVDETE